MSKTFRYPQLAFIFCGKHHTDGFAKGRRTFPHINRYIKNLSDCYPDKLPLRMLNLVVQSTKDIFAGAGMVILNKHGLKACLFCPQLLIKALKEKAPIVSKDFRLNDENIGNFRWGYIHKKAL